MNEKPPTILVVEDDEIVRMNLVELLSIEGFSYLEANDLRTALNLIFQVPSIDLIISDLKLGEGGEEGITILDRIQRDNKAKDIPVIFLSAYAESEKIVRAIQAGAVEYLIKPYSREALLGAIATHLGKVKRTPVKTKPKIQYYIILHSPAHDGEKIVLEPLHTIGRHQQATTQIPDEHASRVTATLQRMSKSDPVYTVLVDGRITGQSTNKPSANGLLLNGKRIVGHAALKNGDRVQISADTWFEYCIELPVTEEGEDGKATVT